jgi:chromosome segregation ATPase
MLKNQHLLAGLVVLGVVNVLALLGLMSGERESTRALNGVEQELVTAREEHKKGLERLGRQNEELQRGLDEARSTIGQLREEADTTRDRMARLRKQVAELDERTSKPPPPSNSEKSKE